MVKIYFGVYLGVGLDVGFVVGFIDGLIGSFMMMGCVFGVGKLVKVLCIRYGIIVVSDLFLFCVCVVI